MGRDVVNYRMVGVGRDLCGSPSPAPCRSRVTQSRPHRTASRRVLNICREGVYLQGTCALTPLQTARSYLATVEKTSFNETVQAPLLNPASHGRKESFKTGQQDTSQQTTPWKVALSTLSSGKHS